MSNVDTRVVEMQFDNKQFEKDMATTVKSLKNFEDLLQKSTVNTKAFDNLTKSVSSINTEIKKVDFSGLSESISKIASRFSLFGNIVFSTVDKLTKDAIAGIEKGLNSVYDTVMTKGMNRALNIEQAQFQLQGLLKDSKKVSAVMDDVSYAVNGTAYGLDEAAKVASQLAASNVKAGTEMKTALRGISGVAAMTSSSYEEIGRIFASIAGQGRVMGDQFNQIAARGLNAKATLASFLNTTEKNITEMTSKGQIDFKTFAAAMDQAFGKQATKANETFTGALSNVKAALGRIGAGFKAPYLTYMRPVLVQLIDNINAVKDAFGPLFDTTSFVFDKLSKLAITFLKNFIDIRKEGKEQIKTVSVLRNIFIKFQKEVKKNWSNVQKGIEFILTASFKILKTITPIFDVIAYLIHDLEYELFHFSNEILKNNSFVKFLDNLGYQVSLFYGTFVRIWPSVKYTFIDTMDAIMDIINTVMTLLGPVQQAFIDAFPISFVVDIVRKGIKTIRAIIKYINSTVLEATNNGEAVYNILTLILTVLKTLIKIVVNVVNAVGRIVKFLAPFIRMLIVIPGKIFNIVSTLFNASEGFARFEAAISKIVETFNKVRDSFAGFAYKIRDTIIDALNGSVLSLDNLRNTITKVKDWIRDHLVSPFEMAAAFVEWLGSKLILLKEFFDKVGAASSATGKKIDEYKNKIKDAGKASEKEAENMSLFEKVISKLKKFFSDLANGIKEFSKKIVNALRTSFSNAEKTTGGFLSSIANKGLLATLQDAFITVAKSIGKGLSIVVTALTPFKNALLEVFGEDTIGGLIEHLVNLFVKYKLGKFMNLFGNFLTGLANGAKKGKPGAIQKFVDGITHPFADLKEMVAKATKDKLSSKLKALALVFVSFAASIWIVSQIPLENLIPAVAALGTLFAHVGGVITIMGQLTKNNDKAATQMMAMTLLMSAFGTAIVKIGLVIALLSKVFDSVELSSFVKATAVVGGIIVLISAFMILFAKMNKRIIDSKQILAYALIIKTLGNAIVKIGLIIAILSLPIFKMSNVITAGAVIGVITAILMAGIYKLVSGFSNFSMSATKIAAVALIIKTLGTAIAKIGLIIGILSLFNPLKVISAGGVVAAIFGLIWALIQGVNTMDPKSSKNFLAVSIFVKLASDAILKIAAVIAILSLPIFDLMGLAKAVLVVIAISAVLSGMLVLTNFAGRDYKKFLSLALLIKAISGAIMAIAAVIAILSLPIFDIGRLWNAVAIVTVISIILSGMMMLSRFVNGDKATKMAKAILFISVAFAALAKALQIMSKFRADAIEAITNTLTTLATMLPKWIGLFVTSALEALSSLIPSIVTAVVDLLVGIVQGVTKNAAIIVKAIVELFKAIATALISMKDAINIKDMFWAISAIALIAGLIFVLQIIASDLKSALIGIGLMALVLAALVVSMGIMTSFKNSDKIPDILNGVAKALLSLIGVFGVIALISIAIEKISKGNTWGVFKAMLVTLAGLAIFIAGSVLLVTIIGWIVNFLGLEGTLANIESATKVMIAVGNALGNFFGSIVGGFLDMIRGKDDTIGVLLALVPLILALEPLLLALPILSAVLIAVAGLFSWMGEENTIKTFTVLKNVMPLLGEVIGGFFGGVVKKLLEVATNAILASMHSFAIGLSLFMLELQPFLTAVKQINASTLESVGMLALIILEMVGTELLAGITHFLSFITGGSASFVSFAAELAGMAPYLVTFSKKLTEGNFNATTVNAAASAMQMMVEVANSLPKEGGLWQNIVGSTMDMTTFGEKLPALGESIVKFSESVSGMSDAQIKAVTPAAEALKMLSDVAKSMPADGGLWQKLVGSTMDMDVFGEKLGGLATGLVKFGTEIVKIDKPQKIKDAIPILTSFTEVASAMPTNGGVWSRIVGKKMDMSDFAEKLKELAIGLYNFAIYTNQLDSARVEKVKGCIGLIQTLAEISNTIGEQKTGGVASWFGGSSKEDLKSFSEKLKPLGTGLADFATETKDISDMSNVKTIAEAIQTLATAFQATQNSGAFTGTFLGRLGALAHGDSKSGNYTPEDWWIVSNLLGPQDGMINNNKSSQLVLNRIEAVGKAIGFLSTAFHNTSDTGAFTGTFLSRVGALAHGDPESGRYQSGDWWIASNVLGEDNTVAQKAMRRIEAVGKAIGFLSTAFNNTSDTGAFTGTFLSRVGALVHGDNDSGSYEPGDFVKIANLFGEDNNKAEAAIKRITRISDGIRALSDVFSATSEVGAFSGDFMKNLDLLINGDGSETNKYNANTLLNASYILGQNNVNVEQAYKRINRIKDSIIALVTAFNESSKMNTEGGKTFLNVVSNFANVPITTIKEEVAKNTKDAVTAMSTLIWNVGATFENKKDAFKKNVTNFLYSIKVSIDENKKALTDYAVNAIKGKDGIIWQIGSAFLDSREALRSNVATFLHAAVNKIEEFNSADRNKPGEFYNAGAHSVQGYVQGIRDNLQSAYNAGFEIGKEAEKGTRNALVVKSPSRRYKEIAYYSVIGLVNEFAARASMVYDAGAELGQNALNGTKGIITRMANIINSDMNLQPVISPVLDLSNISAQSGYIGGILNAGTSIGMASRTASLIEQGRSMRFEASINNGSPDVVAAIDNLTNRMDSMERTIVNRPIMLDKTKVSKEITPEVDRELGRRRTYSRRGN